MSDCTRYLNKDDLRPYECGGCGRLGALAEGLQCANCGVLWLRGCASGGVCCEQRSVGEVLPYIRKQLESASIRCECQVACKYKDLDEHLLDCRSLFRVCGFCRTKLPVDDQTHEDECVAQIPALKREVETLKLELSKHTARLPRSCAGYPDKPPTELTGKYCCWSTQRGWNTCCGISAQHTCQHTPDHGTIRRWYNTGQLMMQSEYKDSLQDGLHTQWYDNGQCWVQCKYAQGVLSDVYTSWWANGQINEQHAHDQLARR